MSEHIGHWVSCPECGARATDEPGGVVFKDGQDNGVVFECKDCKTEERVKVKIFTVFEWDEPKRGGAVELGGDRR